MPHWPVPARRAALWFLAIVIAASLLPPLWDFSEPIADAARAIERATDGWLSPSWLAAWTDIVLVLLVLVCLIGRHRLADAGLSARGLVAGTVAAAALIGFGVVLLLALDLAGRDIRLGGSALGHELVTHLLGIALVEELVHRGFLLRQLWLLAREVIGSPRDAFVLAIAAGSLLFAAAHPLPALSVDTVLIFGEHLLAGAVYAFVYARTGNLWLAVAFHGVNNAMLGLAADDLSRFVVDASFLTLAVAVAVALRSAPPAAPAGTPPAGSTPARRARRRAAGRPRR